MLRSAAAQYARAQGYRVVHAAGFEAVGDPEELLLRVFFGDQPPMLLRGEYARRIAVG
jgi:hypothetical protein